MQARAPRPNLVRVFFWTLLGTLLVTMLVGGASTLSRGALGEDWVATAHAVDELDGASAVSAASTAAAANDVDVAVAEDASSEQERTDIGAARDSVETPFYLRLVSLFGLFVYVGLACLLSTNRRAINWRLVTVGLGMQFVFGLFILRTSIGRSVFEWAGSVVSTILDFTKEGSKLLFGSFANGGEVMPSFMNFAFDVLPTIVFFSSLMSILYHLNIMQRIVGVVASAMRRTLQTSGAETLSATANIFVGQTEAPLMVKPYVAKMTMSELMAVMTGGFATVAGGVMASYIGFLQAEIPDIAEHLMAASVMSAPAALVMAKIIYPETETPETADGVSLEADSPYDNVIDAAAGGAAEGMKLAMNVAAMLLAFVALVAMMNYLVAYPSYAQHGLVLGDLLRSLASQGDALPEALAYCDILAGDVKGPLRFDCIDALTPLVHDASAASPWTVVTLERALGWVFYPIGLITGAPFSDALHLGELYGQKTILNEFYAYVQLLGKVNDPEVNLSLRTVVIASYGLCGFANLSSIAIQIGGIGGIAPERRGDLASIGIRAMIGGTLAAWMTGNIVGLLM